MADPVITRYCLKVKFRDLEQNVFFEVEALEFDRVRDRCARIVDPHEFVFLTTSDGNEVMISARNTESFHFLVERSLEDIPTLKLVREEDWVVKYHIRGKPDSEYLGIASPREAVLFHRSLRAALETDRMERPALYCSIADVEGKEFFINLRNLLYLAIPKAVMEGGGRAG